MHDFIFYHEDEDSEWFDVSTGVSTDSDTLNDLDEDYVTLEEIQFDNNIAEEFNDDGM